MAKVSVFISFPHSDELWVREFVKSLRQHGLEVWPDEQSVQAGESWEDALERGLRESHVMVLDVTPDSLKSPNLFFELGTALGTHKQIISIISREVDPASLPPVLRAKKFLVKSSPRTTAEELVFETLGAPAGL